MLENFPEPSTLRFTTGGDEEAEITRQRDVFFQDIREELGLGTTRCDVFFTADSQQMIVSIYSILQAYKQSRRCLIGVMI